MYINLCMYVFGSVRVCILIISRTHSAYNHSHPSVTLESLLWEDVCAARPCRSLIHACSGSVCACLFLTRLKELRLTVELYQYTDV